MKRSIVLLVLSLILTVSFTSCREKTEKETLEVYPGRKEENEERKEKQVRIF